jgi:hypothetical protein
VLQFRVGVAVADVVFGGDRSGVRLIGDTDDVAQLVDEAQRLLRVAGGSHEQCAT